MSESTLRKHGIRPGGKQSGATAAATVAVNPADIDLSESRVPRVPDVPATNLFHIYPLLSGTFKDDESLSKFSTAALEKFEQVMRDNWDSEEPLAFGELGTGEEEEHFIGLADDELDVDISGEIHHERDRIRITPSSARNIYMICNKPSSGMPVRVERLGDANGGLKVENGIDKGDNPDPGWFAACRVVMEGGGRGDAELSGLGSGTVMRLGDGDGNAVRRGRGDGSAERYGGGDGDAERTGDGNGDAVRTGDGNGHAQKLGAGDGDAVRTGNGYGDARCSRIEDWYTKVGNGHAYRDGAGDGDAVKWGGHSASFSTDGNAIRDGSGKGNAVFRGTGTGRAYRNGDGDGYASREDDGDGDAYRDGAGDGDARRWGDGAGHAIRSGSGDGHATRSGKGAGNAYKDGEGSGNAVKKGEGSGNAYLQAESPGQATVGQDSDGTAYDLSNR